MEPVSAAASKKELLDKKNAEAALGGGEKRINAQHAKGKLTARERIEILVDKGSFEEIGKFVMHRSKDLVWTKSIIWVMGS